MLQFGAALFYYKSEQTLLQIRAVSLLQIRASVVTNWVSYYKSGQPLLQNNKVEQLLQVETKCITNWGWY